MISHVVDASMFGPLFFDGERDDLFAGLPGLIADEACIVPQHWRLEVTGQILNGLRRKRITPVMAEQALAQIEHFPIAIDSETWHRCDESYGLARKHGLTIYDAAYLELAMRRKLPLATYDIELRAAAIAESMVLLPE